MWTFVCISHNLLTYFVQLLLIEQLLEKEKLENMDFIIKSNNNIFIMMDNEEDLNSL